MLMKAAFHSLGSAVWSSRRIRRKGRERGGVPSGVKTSLSVRTLGNKGSPAWRPRAMTYWKCL